MKHPALISAPLVLAACLGLSTNARADLDEGIINLCLKAWGDHPFKDGTPPYRRYSDVVNVFGIGTNTDDLAASREPELVLIDSALNVMGGTTIRLMNPNGWYCFRSNTNVMGKVTIKAHCKAHIASASEGLNLLGEDQHHKSTTVMGLTHIELIGCEDPAAAEDPHAPPRNEEIPKPRRERTPPRRARPPRYPEPDGEDDY